jgi:hypothetical protein
LPSTGSGRWSDVGAVDVRVQDADGGALLGQGHGQVDGHGALAHAALAAGDRHDVLDGDLQAAGDAGVAAHVGVELDRHLLHAGDLHHRRLRLALHLPAQRASRRGQHDGEGHLPAFDVHILDHLEADQVVVQLRLLHGAQGCQDVLLGYTAVLLAKHVLVLALIKIARLLSVGQWDFALVTEFTEETQRTPMGRQ